MTRRPILEIAAAAFILSAVPALAMDGEHGGQVFHLVRAEVDWSKSDGKDLFAWDASGWIGGDRDKAWFRSEGETLGGKTEQAELWGMYSRNIAAFWDVQAGIRQDFEPTTVTYAVIGIEGLAKYFFETSAHAFVSDKGDVSARIAQAIDLLITQRLIAEPHIELNLYAQDVPDRHIGAGLSDIEVGLQFRYEILREFAPYVDVNYARAVGETASRIRAAGEDPEEFTVRLGLRFWL